jgi:hypothetical protein
MRIPRREPNHLAAGRILGHAAVHACIIVEEPLKCSFCDFGGDCAFVLRARLITMQCSSVID